MARKIKFALEMKDGVEIRRNLDELREHFDMEMVIEHFLSGKLQKWLEDRYYDEEASKIKMIDKDSDSFHRQLCEALGVEYEGEMPDIEEMERVNEKKAILRERTSDAEILSHAAQTAFTQEDLSDLLDMDEKEIYLCGERFNVPIRMEGKRYIGILGTPVIRIQASCQADLDKKDISFENVQLPWIEDSVDDTILVDEKEVAAIAAAASVVTDEQESASKSPNEASAMIEKNKAALQENIQRFLQDINESYLTDWMNSPPLLIINDYGSTSKSEIKNAIQDAAVEYENEMRDGFTEAADNRLQMLQDLQAKYEDIFQQSGSAYIAPSPTLQEVWKSVTKGHQALLSACSGLSGMLPSRARFEALPKVDSWNPFESTDYLLENSTDLSDFADQHYERVASQYNHSDFSNAVRAYVRSIKRNMERLVRR